MKKIERFITEEKPFAIMQYFVWFKGDVDAKQKRYELIYVDENNDKRFISIDNINDVLYIKTKLELFTLVQQNKHGKVWEFNKFKESLSN